MSMMKFFTYIIIIQLFYSFGISMLSYSLDKLVVQQRQLILSQFQTLGRNITEITQSIEKTTQSSMNIPLIDLGALVFYSGNIIVDLMVNFLFAIPSMATLLVSSFQFFFSTIDPILISNLKLFLYSIISVIYFIALIQFLLSIRARSPGVI
ncbi:MAG: hypothetical protein QW156_04515 [Candidatus Aenigmatarchaeota archaeon]